MSQRTFTRFCQNPCQEFYFFFRKSFFLSLFEPNSEFHPCIYSPIQSVFQFSLNMWPDSSFSYKGSVRRQKRELEPVPAKDESEWIMAGTRGWIRPGTRINCTFTPPHCMCSDFESTEKRLDPLQTPCYLPTVQNHSRTGKILMILACSGPRSILELKGFGTGVPVQFVDTQ